MHYTNVVDLSEIGSEQPEIHLIQRRPFQILIEQSKDVRLELPPRHQWRSVAGVNFLHQPTNISRRIDRISVEVRRVTA